MYATTWLTSLRKGETATGVNHRELAFHAAKLTAHIHRQKFVSQVVGTLDHVGRLPVAAISTNTEVKATREAILQQKNTEEPYNPEGPSSVTLSNAPEHGGNSKK